MTAIIPAESAEKAALDRLRGFVAGYLIRPGQVLAARQEAPPRPVLLVVRGMQIEWLDETTLAVRSGWARIGIRPDLWAIRAGSIRRLVLALANRIQTQERLTLQIAEALDEHLLPRGCGVIIDCGPDRTSVLLGTFEDGPDRDEFLRATG